MTTTDRDARACFRRCWAFVSPGVILIRRMTLALVKEEAERFARVIAALAGTAGSVDRSAFGTGLSSTRSGLQAAQRA